MRLETYEAMIGTLKHEWNNLAAIALPLLKKTSELHESDSNADFKKNIIKTKNTLERILDTISLRIRNQ